MIQKLEDPHANLNPLIDLMKLSNNTNQDFHFLLLQVLYFRQDIVQILFHLERFLSQQMHMEIMKIKENMLEKF